MSGNPPFLPPEFVQAWLTQMVAVNGGRDLNIIVALVESGCPPVLVSSIHPDQVPDILRFMADNHKNAKVEANLGVESGTLN